MTEGLSKEPYTILRLQLGLATASAVKVTLSEFRIESREVIVKAGEVTFVVTNEGIIEHSFVLEMVVRRP